MKQQLTLETLPNAVGQLSQKLENIERLLLNHNTNSSEPVEKLLNIDEAAKYLSLSKATLYSKVSRRELPFCKKSKRLYFSSLDLLAFIKEGRVKTIEELKNEPVLIKKRGRK